VGQAAHFGLVIEVEVPGGVACAYQTPLHPRPGLRA
jgi:hypothetical protein